MQVFYTNNISGDIAIFNEEESMHGIKVLRLYKGAPLTFTDGKGNMYQGEVITDNSRKMEARINSLESSYGHRDYYLHMAVSPLKNRDRYEWFVEKAVEMGIDELTPLLCDHTEKQTVREDRVSRIMISAMKQSVKAYLPQLNEAVAFSQFVSNSGDGLKLIAHCNGRYEREPVTTIMQQAKRITIVVGPEGDFSENEIELAGKNGFRAVTLGESRLRTETAGIVACCSAYLSNI